MVFGHFAGVLAQIGLQRRVIYESSNKKNTSPELGSFRPKKIFRPIYKVDFAPNCPKVTYNVILVFFLNEFP